MDSFWASVVGALVGGALSFVATWIQHYLQQKTKNAEKKENIKTALEAIYVEIVTLWEMCEHSIGMPLRELENDKHFPMHYEITQDYFTFYNQNASVIASLPDQEIQKKIIQAYAYARQLIDGLQVNNYAINQYEMVLREKPVWESVAIESGKDKGEVIHAAYASLVQVAVNLKPIHQQVDVAVQDLLPLLRDKITTLQ